VNLEEIVEIHLLELQQQRNLIDYGINSYIGRNVHDPHYCNNILLTGTDFPIFAQKVELECIMKIFCNRCLLYKEETSTLEKIFIIHSCSTLCAKIGKSVPVNRMLLHLH